MARQIESFDQLRIAFFIPKAIYDLGVFKDTRRNRIAGQLVYGLENDTNGTVLFSDGLIVEFDTLQYVLEFELFGELVEQDNALFGTVAPDGPLYSGLDKLEHHGQYFLVVLDFIQFKNDQTFILDSIGLIFVHLEQEAIYTIPDILGHDMKKVLDVEIGIIDTKLIQQFFLVVPYKIIEPL